MVREVGSVGQLRQAPSMSNPPLCPGAQVRPNTLILDDNVVIMLACHDGMTLSLCAPGPTQLLSTPIDAEAWHCIVLGAEYVITPEES
jgi:hypothetical protein